MKKLTFLLFTIIALLISSCANNSPLPDKSILDEMTSSEIATAIQYEKDNNIEIFGEGSFEDLYSEMRKSLDRLPSSERLSFAPLTYRELAEACAYMQELNNNKTIEAEMIESMPSGADFHDAWKYRLNFYLEIVGKKYPYAAKFIAIW